MTSIYPGYAWKLPENCMLLHGVVIFLEFFAIWIAFAISLHTVALSILKALNRCNSKSFWSVLKMEFKENFLLKLNAYFFEKATHLGIAK